MLDLLLAYTLLLRIIQDLRRVQNILQLLVQISKLILVDILRGSQEAAVCVRSYIFNDRLADGNLSFDRGVRLPNVMLFLFEFLLNLLNVLGVFVSPIHCFS